MSASILNNPKIKNIFSVLYGTNAETLKHQTERYSNLINQFEKKFGSSDVRLFSSPGRSEISGNHTDHNYGKVLASSIQLDCIGAVKATDDNKIAVCDLTYNEDYSIDINQSARINGEKGSIALVRGIVQGFKNAGYKTGGFNGMFTSEVIAAAGVSSSASFEMMICTILNKLYNEGTIPVSKLAAIGQFAENTYWDKSSGLLDQMACATGGLIQIDFKDPSNPIVEKVPFDFSKQKYSLIIVNTGKSHADLSAEYSSIPSEMKSVAAACGQNVLRGLSKEDIISRLSELRAKCGDRAVMRAFHFIDENNRVDNIVSKLKGNDFNGFLELVTESGNSSWKWLQNTYVAVNEKEQSIPVCLALTELFIKDNCPKTAERPGACRIHGGGFAGVIMALIPEELTEKYKDYMHKALNVGPEDKDPVYIMAIRPEGSIELA